MNYSIFDFLNMIGALGVFLYGMKIMSEGIQKVAGEKLRSILGAMTKNRVMGVLTGFFITSIIQSSSATTVMVVSFVNAGLLTLGQSIGVIMGANIGTTITAWLISIVGFKFSISAIALPLIGICFPLFFSKRDFHKSIAETFTGFGLLFIGLDFLKNSVPDLKSNPEMLEALGSLTDFGFGSVLIFVLIGTLLTIVVQSSSAAMALTLVMCHNGWIGFEHGAAIVLGENIGTTITANLAAIMGNKLAKRAAISHSLFNVIGVIWMLIIFYPFTESIAKFIENSTGENPYLTSAAIPFSLSIFHTSFNILNTFFLVWFVNTIENLVNKIIPTDPSEKNNFHLEYIGTGIMSTPELSLLEAKKEILKYSNIVKKMFNFIPSFLVEVDPQKSKELFDRIEKYENITDKIEEEVATFLTKISENELSERSSKSVRSMLRIISNLEKIGDLNYSMALNIQKKNEHKAWFTPSQRDNMKAMFELLNQAFDNMVANLDKEANDININLAIELEKQVNELRNKIRDEHFVSIEKGEYNIKSGLYYNNMYTNCERVGDHIMNVNEALTGINLE